MLGETKSTRRCHGVVHRCPSRQWVRGAKDKKSAGQLLSGHNPQGDWCLSFAWAIASARCSRHDVPLGEGDWPCWPLANDGVDRWRFLVGRDAPLLRGTVRLDSASATL